MPDGRPSKKAVSKTKSEIYLARGLWLPGSGAGSGFWRERRVGLDGATARNVADYPLNRDRGGALKGPLSVGVAPCKPLMEVG